MDKSLMVSSHWSLALLKWLYHPMLLTSLALHGLVVLLPLPSSPPAPAEPEPEDLELSSLTPLTPLSPKPSPVTQATPKPQVQSSPKAIASPPPVLLQRHPVSQSLVSPAPLPSPSPTVAASPSPTPIAPATPSPPPEEQDLQNYIGELQSGLQGVAADETAGLGIPCYLFPQPEPYFTPDSLSRCLTSGAQPQTVPEIDSLLWASRKRPDDVLAELKSRFAGFEFTPMTPFGGGDLYQMTKGATVRYVNLVRATSRTATFVVIWNRDPHAPAEANSPATMTRVPPRPTSLPSANPSQQP